MVKKDMTAVSTGRDRHRAEVRAAELLGGDHKDASTERIFAGTKRSYDTMAEEVWQFTLSLHFYIVYIVYIDTFAIVLHFLLVLYTYISELISFITIFN